MHAGSFVLAGKKLQLWAIAPKQNTKIRDLILLGGPEEKWAEKTNKKSLYALLPNELYV